MNRNRARMLRGWGEGHDTSRRAAADADDAPTASKNESSLLHCSLDRLLDVFGDFFFSLSFFHFLLFEKKSISPTFASPLRATLRNNRVEKKPQCQYIECLSRHIEHALLRARVKIHFLWLYTEWKMRNKNWAVLSHYTSLEGIVV